MDRACDAIRRTTVRSDRPYAGGSYDDLSGELSEVDAIPDRGVGLDATIEWVADNVLSNSALVSDPRCVAHLQCPPLVSGLVAEAMLSAANQSLDSWDQSPAATVVEESLVSELCDLFGYGVGADGVFTSGGTQSNLMGLLLARDRHVHETWGRWVQDEGLPPEADSLRVLCSSVGHFTAKQAAAQLGLGEDAVVSVPTDDEFRMDPAALDETVARLRDDGSRPFALVGTAGTTDFGSVDPLSELADRADAHDLWFHVDAAYGGALALSDEHRGVLAGIDRADSIAVDFHKLFYQPISCGAFLLRDGSNYRYVARNAAYLNPESDEEAGVSNLVSKSLQTTRRFDALKPFVTFRALGRKGVAELVEYTLDLADDAADLIDRDPAFELVNEPTLNAVVFRYEPFRSHPDLADDEWADRLNREIRDRLLERGVAIVARTEVARTSRQIADEIVTDVCLKFTLLNPQTTIDDVADVLTSVKRYGAAVESEVAG
nr:aspartate aminotransferase family protein [Halegenticoccus tardaugens]